jgi:hypothetical protein
MMAFVMIANCFDGGMAVEAFSLGHPPRGVFDNKEQSYSPGAAIICTEVGSTEYQELGVHLARCEEGV